LSYSLKNRNGSPILVWRAVRSRLKRKQQDYPDPRSGFLLPFLVTKCAIIVQIPYFLLQQRYHKNAELSTYRPYESHMSFECRTPVSLKTRVQHKCLCRMIIGMCAAHLPGPGEANPCLRPAGARRGTTGGGCTSPVLSCCQHGCAPVPSRQDSARWCGYTCARGAGADVHRERPHRV